MKGNNKPTVFDIIALHDATACTDQERPFLRPRIW